MRAPEDAHESIPAQKLQRSLARKSQNSFGNRYYVDSGSGYTYSSFFGSDDATVDGRMVGRTLCK